MKTAADLGNKTTLSCGDCSRSVERRSPTQRYCRECSEKRDLIRKGKWSREHPPTKDQQSNIRQRRREVIEERGREFSRLNAQYVDWMADEEPDLSWVIRVSLPFDYSYSKNAAWRMVKIGHVYLTDQARVFRAALADTIRTSLERSGQVVVQGKLWLDILVQKPNHTGDAVNVVDAVCDAVKVAVGLDDRWYSIRRLDWQVIKENPRLIVGIGQDIESGHRVCSSCGRVLPFEMFNRNKSTRDGMSRECKECTRGTRRLK